jgi:2-methylcitrate dehydratase PrpD
MAARLAARGFIANPDALECPQGFGATQSTGFRALPVRPDPEAPFAVEANLFKYHAACYLTHSSIVAARALRAEHGFEAADVTGVRARVRETHLSVCGIAAPRTGLEVKFSLRHVIAMALAGDETGDRSVYTAETATRPDLVALREKVRIEPKALERRTAAELVVDLADGRRLVKHADVGVPADDSEGQGRKLEAKFLGLAGPVIGRQRAREAVARVAALEAAEGMGDLLAAVS